MPDIHLSLLDSIQIASPCHAKWEEMTGDERTRFCAECSLHVHNISDMTRHEAELFLHDWVGSADENGNRARLCGQVFRRADGTVLTRDCPVGLAAVRARARRTLVRISAALGLAGLTTIAAASQRAGPFGRLRGVQPFAFIAEKLAPSPPSPPVMGKMCVKGEIALPQTPPQTNTASGSARGN